MWSIKERIWTCALKRATTIWYRRRWIRLYDRWWTCSISTFDLGCDALIET
jgi:hypothetical protein